MVRYDEACEGGLVMVRHSEEVRTFGVVTSSLEGRVAGVECGGCLTWRFLDVDALRYIRYRGSSFF